MKFVDRKEEKERLEKALNSERPSFIAIYGRRRLGKSTLIKKVLDPSDIYFLADKSESQHQRHLLSDVISQKFPEFNSVEYPGWETLLRQLNLRTNERFTLCLDEFPYLVEQAPELPSILQKLLDEKSLKYNIIICGSSQTMMYGLVLDATAPLYGRADEIMKLSPLRLPYIGEALNLNVTESIVEYSIWGGVPRYWELREGKPTLEEALWNNVFNVNGIFFDEPAKIFQDDIKDIVKTSTIISYIAAGANRLSEIAARCHEPATNLSRPLRKLLDLGYVDKEVPFGTNMKNSKKSLYHIADPFISFYYKFVIPNQSFIELGRTAPIEMALHQRLHLHISQEWEKLCRQAITGNNINGVIYGEAQRWWGSVINESGKPEPIELDVVAESVDGKYLLVGECKWTNEENSEALTENLLRKAKLLPFSNNRTIIPVLFLKKARDFSLDNVFLPGDICRLSY